MGVIMNEEVLPCGIPWCDVYDMTPWKSQCSYEGTGKCGSEAAEVLDNIMDKTKILVTNKESFNEIKDLESEIQRWKKIADDWRETATALAISLGDADIAIDVYEDIRTGLYEVVRDRMIPNTSAQKSFDNIHDYAILLSTKAGKVSELRAAAQDAGSTDYYYWDGYIEALDIAIDLLPNYND
jgi:hypothetical protein